MEDNKKHSLGRRAFVIFFVRRIRGPIVFFAIATAGWYAERWVTPGSAIFIWFNFGVEVLFLSAFAYLLIVLALAYASYRSHKYMFTEEAFMVMSGIAARNEAAALYHQIHSVNIVRSMSDRVVGVSQIVILMTGSDREGGHTQLLLPSLSKSKAKLVQKELLSRARKHMGREAA